MGELPANYKIFGSNIALVQEIRKSVLNLGDDVVEDVRMHRIVYGRKIIFRNFLDIRPLNNNVIATVRKGKLVNDPRKLALDKGMTVELTLEPEELDYALELIKQSYLAV